MNLPVSFESVDRLLPFLLPSIEVPVEGADKLHPSLVSDLDEYAGCVYLNRHTGPITYRTAISHNIINHHTEDDEGNLDSGKAQGGLNSLLPLGGKSQSDPLELNLIPKVRG